MLDPPRHRVPVCLIGAALDGTITQWSAGARQVYGWTEQEILGRHVSTLAPRGSSDASTARAELLAGGDPPPFEARCVRRSGALFTAFVSLSLLRDDRGEVVGTLAVHHRVEASTGSQTGADHDTPVAPEGQVLAEDLTVLHDAAQTVRTQAVRFEAVLQTMPIVVLTYDRAGVCTSASGRALGDLGVSPDELVGRRLQTLYVDAPASLAALEASLAGQQGHVIDDAGAHTWESHYRPLFDAAGAVTGGLAVGVQVTARVAAEREVRAHEVRLRALLEYATDVVVVLDRTGRLVYVSPAIRRHLGYDDRSLFWQPGGEFDHPEDRSVVNGAWRRVLQTPGASEVFESRLRHADGSWRWTEHVMTNLLDTPGIDGVVLNLRDVSERREAEARLQHLALHDGLTGLANRALLLDRIGQAMAWGRRDDHRTGLVLLDVQGLAGINATSGQRAGDVVLTMVAERLTEAVRETDSVARVSGDGFVVLLEDVASLEELRTRAADLREAVSLPVLVGGVSIEVQLRAATSVTPASSPGALLAAAERASSTASDDLAATTGGLGPDSDDAVAIEELRRAITQEQLRMHLQPVMSLRDGTMAGAEALVRWQHPERGLLAPSAFIGLAERSGLINELGEWILRQACAQSAAWTRAGLQVGVGVNLSPRQLVGAGFAGLLRDALQTTGAEPGRLILEVTESAVMDDPAAPAVLRELHEMGVRLALDDFGTGYSSLTYLKRFPVDALKIDRSFVSGLGRDSDDEAIVASIVSLARSIGKIVVAEGVETPQQLAALRALGVDQAQGYLWSPALSPDLLDAWLTEQAPLPLASLPRTPAARPAVTADEDGARILALSAEGASLHTIAAALNADGHRTRTGSRWSSTAVARVIAALSRT